MKNECFECLDTSEHKAKELRLELCKTKLLIIDEISMVSNVLLNIIDLRLTEIMRRKQPFAGWNIMFFGDLMQLPPVGVPLKCGFVMNACGKLTQF